MRLIDADALLDRIRNPYEQAEVARWVNEMPTIEEHKWIPCSERLPEKSVLCCSKVGTMIIGLPVPNTMMSVTGYNADGDVCLMPNCVAWMPLPEPYRAERREDE